MTDKHFTDIARRSFLSGVVGVPLMAQSTGKPVNLDEHGDMDHAPRLAGEDAASTRLLRAAAPGAGSLPVLTRGYSNLRWGSNTRETKLTPAAVRAAGGLRLLFTMTMPGDKRGCEAQPLIAPAITIADGTTHDVCVVATMSNHVYAFDAIDGTPLWMVRLGNPVVGSRKIDAWLINDRWGVLSTGVIGQNTLYVVSWSSPDGTPEKATHRLHGLSLRDGRQAKPALTLTKPGNIQRKQRASLTLVGKTVYVPWGTVQETAKGAHGFITAVDTDAWKITTEWNATPTGLGGGIWQAGAGLVADDEGFLYAMTGNGTFDGAKNFGECFVKLRGDGTVVDWWTPYRDDDRTQSGGWDDQDLGAGGPVVIPELGLVLGSGKDGILYVLDWRKMGKPTAAGQYDMLKSPPIFFTYFPGFGVNAAPKNPKELDRLWFDKTHHHHGSPIVWKSDKGYRLFCWGENGNLRGWSVDANGKVQFLARSTEVASPYAPAKPGGMPGAMMCLTANGGNDGILWCCVPDGDANKEVTTARVFAFDAQDFGKLDDGDPGFRRLWMSGPDHYVYNKFNVPVVSAGKLYVPTYSGTIEVWGL